MKLLDNVLFIILEYNKFIYYHRSIRINMLKSHYLQILEDKENYDDTN